MYRGVHSFRAFRSGRKMKMMVSRSVRCALLNLVPCLRWIEDLSVPRNNSACRREERIALHSWETHPVYLFFKEMSYQAR
jgi:hypothetical protein